MKLERSMKRWSLLLCASLTLASCKVDPAPGASSAPAAEANLRLGKPLQGLAPTPLGTILDHPAEYEGRVVAVQGLIARACTRKGCWMEIAEQPGEQARACRVTFEDYAFFVPKDSPGSRTKLEGKVVTSRIKVSHVEHLESEGARFTAKNPDGSALEVQIVATGVEIERHAAPQKQL